MLYHGLQGRVHTMLTQIPWSRERVRKDEALTRLLTNKKTWDGHLSAFTLTELVEFAKDYASSDRYWRLLTKDHEELRGSDWDTKQIVEERKQLEIGYEPRYHENVRSLAGMTP